MVAGVPYHAQMEFLHRAYRLQKAACARGGVQERAIYENYEVSTRFYYEKGLLTHREFEMLTAMYVDMRQQVCAPLLLFHLTASFDELLRRTDARGRKDDRLVTVSQMQDLERYYQRMLTGWQLSLVVCIDTSELTASEVALLIVKKARLAKGE